MEILLDASAIMAFIADEPEGDLVIQITRNSIIISPDIISIEISNALTRMMRKSIISTKQQLLMLIQNFKMIPIQIVEVDIEKALEIAWDYKIYAYDAFYLEVAKRLKLPVLTFDKGMKRVGQAMNLLMV